MLIVNLRFFCVSFLSNIVVFNSDKDNDYDFVIYAIFHSVMQRKYMYLPELPKLGFVLYPEMKNVLNPIL